MLAVALTALANLALRSACPLEFSSRGPLVVASVVLSAGQVAAPTERHGAPAAHCCERAEDAALVKPADALASWLRGGSPGTAFIASVGLLALARWRALQSQHLAALPGRSFYARSARILR